ncbi:MAG: hypothetical protein WCT77_00360 [Bacteroidota bacterium]|jgi:hypothetical protein
MEKILASEIELFEGDALLELTAKKKWINIRFTWEEGNVYLNIVAFGFIKINIDVSEVFKLLFHKQKRKHESNN